MVTCFMYLIMTKRLTALVALIVVPIVFALIGGFYAGLGGMMLDGIKTLAPTGVMLTFSILYFGIMIDAGLFDSLVRCILKIVKGDPLKVLVGTTILTMLVSLDGDSSTTYMIVVAAFLPLYQRLGMSVLGLTCVVNIANGIMNISRGAALLPALRLRCMSTLWTSSCRWCRRCCWAAPACSSSQFCWVDASVRAWV